MVTNGGGDEIRRRVACPMPVKHQREYSSGQRDGLRSTVISSEAENQRILSGEAKRLAEDLDGTAEQ